MRYPESHFLGSQRNGVNQVGMNLGSFDRTVGPVRGTKYPTFSDQLLNWYQLRGMTSVRVMFTWEAVQSSLLGPVPALGQHYAEYWSDLTGLVTRLLARGIYVVLCPWQYNPVSDDTDIVYDGQSFSQAAFADFWQKFSSSVNALTANDQRVAFDLINEPHLQGGKPGDVGIGLNPWFDCAQAAITAMRGTGAKNTILVPGMEYTSASGFVTNGSAARWLTLSDPQQNLAVTVHCYSGLKTNNLSALSSACQSVVTWARTNKVKVHVGEIAIDAGPNGRATTCSTFVVAQAQWQDWAAFCAANSDVLIGWNWWANSAPQFWNAGDSCDPAGFHWALSLDDGATQTVYMNLIEPTLPVALPHIRDVMGDTGAEPDTLTAIGWESPDVWPRQTADGLPTPEEIMGGQPAVVYVRVHNHGTAATDDNLTVRLYWAKASAGLSWPAPWNGSIAGHGGMIGAPKPVGVIPPSGSAQLEFVWNAAPDPMQFAGDGHFCLLAVVTVAAAADFSEFEGPNLNENVLAMNTVAWRNIHILPSAMDRFGRIVVSNPTDRPMTARLAFEVLDSDGRVIAPARHAVTVTAEGAHLETLRAHQQATPSELDSSDRTVFRVRDPVKGIGPIALQPHAELQLTLHRQVRDEGRGMAIRAIQFEERDGGRVAIGGQTFVAGSVRGLSEPDRHGRRG